jgi:hypothetical protein
MRAVHRPYMLRLKGVSYQASGKILENRLTENR